MKSSPKTVTRQRRDCDLNPGPTAPESSTLTTRLPIHPGDMEAAAAAGPEIRAVCLRIGSVSYNMYHYATEYKYKQTT